MKDFLSLERPFWIWCRRPCAQGVGVDPCMLNKKFRNKLQKKNSENLDRKNYDSHRHDRILRIFLRPEIGPFSPHHGAIPLLNYTKNLEKKEKSTGENSKNPVETAPRNCRFLSLVVVERALEKWPTNRTGENRTGEH